MDPSTFRTNLKTLLESRSNLSDIDTQVYKYPPGSMADTRPTIFLRDFSILQEDGTLLPSSTLDRTFTFNGSAYKEVAGSQESKWADAEGTAYTLINELEQALLADQSVGTACTQARLSEWTLSPRTDAQKRVFMDVDFIITVRDIG